jgi:hypothetical protein
VGRTRRVASHPRQQAPASPGGRRSHPGLLGPDSQRGPGPDPRRLHRRTRFRVRAGPAPARKLDQRAGHHAPAEPRRPRSSGWSGVTLVIDGPFGVPCLRRLVGHGQVGRPGCRSRAVRGPRRSDGRIRDVRLGRVGDAPPGVDGQRPRRPAHVTVPLWVCSACWSRRLWAAAPLDATSGHQWGSAGLRARMSRHRGPPSRYWPRAVKGTARTVKPAAVRSSRTASSGLVR